MDKLPYDRFIKARDYIFAHSEDIGRAWFRYNFEDGDTLSLIHILLPRGFAGMPRKSAAGGGAAKRRRW